MYLADQDDSGFVEEDELSEINNACGIELILDNGKLNPELKNKQLKKGIEYFENKYKEWV